MADTDARVEGLLTIDVEAEVRKLSERQFPGEANMLAEIIRTAISLGARQIRMRSGRRGLRFAASGAILPTDLMGRLFVICDRTASAETRHAALVECEERQALPLLALVSERRLTMHSGGEVLRVTPTDAVRQPSRGDRFLRFVLGRVVAAKEMRRLAKLCRYANIPIVINGRRASHGLSAPDTFACMAFETSRFTGVVGLPIEGSLCHTAYLDRQVVRRDAFGLSPRGYAHVAVVNDLGAALGDDIDTDGANRAVRQVRSRLYGGIRERFAALRGVEKIAARDLLFTRCEKSGDLRPLLGLPIFRRLAGEPVDIAEVRNTASGGVLWAVDRASAMRRWLAEPRRVYLLDQRERNFLSEVLGVAFAEPPSRTGDAWPHRVMRAMRRSIRDLVRATQSVLAAAISQSVVGRAELSADECLFVDAITEQLQRGLFVLPGIPGTISRRTRVEMVQRGVLPLRPQLHGAARVLRIPRNNPAVRQMIRALAADPTVIYPIVVGLFGGHDGYGQRKAPLQSALMGSA